jgi:hypothetical protein
VLVEWNGGSFPVSVTVVVQPPPNSPPVITSPLGSCSSFAPTSTFEANATDNGSVVSVVVTYLNVNGAARSVTLTNAGGNHWTGTGGDAKNGSNYQVVAKDNLGLVSTLSFTPNGSCFV